MLVLVKSSGKFTLMERGDCKGNKDWQGLQGQGPAVALSSLESLLSLA
jgi:hypothetical protein